MSNRSLFAQMMRQLFNTQAGTEAVVADISKSSFTYTKDADDATAGTATAETAIWVVPYDCNVTAVSYATVSTLTADNTNYATITLKDAGVVVAQITTKAAASSGTGDIASLVPVAITLSTTLTRRLLTAGDVLTITISKTGTGIVVPAGVFTVKYTET